MVKVKAQYVVGLASVSEMIWSKRQGVEFHEANFADTKKFSRKLPISECRVFRKFSHGFVERPVKQRDEFGQYERDEAGDIVIDMVPIRSAAEFMVLDFKGAKKKHVIKDVLQDGFTMKYNDGTTAFFKRVSRSAAKSRTAKALFTRLDPHLVRERCSYGAQFEEFEVISKMEARFGLIESSTTEINIVPTIDIMPDYEITREHTVEMYDNKEMELFLEEYRSKVYTPLDGQGTMLPSYAVKVSHDLELISKREMSYMLAELAVNADPRVIASVNPTFAKMWNKVPSAFLIRFGFAKGLLVVHPHNLETMDCNGNASRGMVAKKGVMTRDKVLKFWGEDEHTYNFNADIMFTDSMWKANFDREYLTGKEVDGVMEYVKLEVVRWAKKPRGRINMGYQYWQALKPTVDPKQFATLRINEIKETILDNADDARAFLGNIDMVTESGEHDANEYEANMGRAGGRIQKILEMLNEDAGLIADPYIQMSIKKMRETYIDNMAQGRIPVEGANPFIITAPELQFGRKSELAKGQYYYNGTQSRYAIFRSPLTHRSEAVSIHTYAVDAYDALYRDLLVFNPFDDSLPRMGGADTDGDTVALVDNDEIADGIYDDLPMLFDPGANAEPQQVSDEAIFNFDYTTIVSDVPSIGEITNWATTWKDIAQNRAIMREMEIDHATIDTYVKILRFAQGASIDYAKTGFFPNIPGSVMIDRSPTWKPWTEATAEEGTEAMPYVSRSRLGILFHSVKKYLANEFYAESETKTRDFSFEFSAGADMDQVQEIMPIIAQLERGYRNELKALHDLELPKEQMNDQMSFIIDKYQRATMSIDADVATIGAAAYQQAYYENGSNGKSISFPWVICYEALLANVAVSEGDKNKLRTSRYTGHLEDIPEELKFYRGESKGEGYTVTAKVKNGTYRTYRKNGNLYIKVTGRTNSKIKRLEAMRSKTITLAFDIVGFRHNNLSAQQVIDAIKANNNEIQVRVGRDDDNQEQRAAVYAGRIRIGSVSRNGKMMVAPYMGYALSIKNIDQLNPIYKYENGRAIEASFFALDAMVVVEEEIMIADDSEDMNFDFPVFDPEVVEQIEAPYFAYDINPIELKLGAIAVEQVGDIKKGQVCAEVTLTNRYGDQKMVEIEVVPGKRFGIIGDVKLPAIVRDYVLQVAHYELFAAHLQRQAQ